MKQLIKKILIQEESLKHNLRQQVKDYGWKDTAEMINGPEELAKLAFNNDPMEFLHMFDDLDVVQSDKKKNFTLTDKPKSAYNKQQKALGSIQSEGLKNLLDNL